jgi:hypothetical protein
MEKAEWKPFRNAFHKSERKEFDNMFDIPRLYLTACSNSAQLVPTSSYHNLNSGSPLQRTKIQLISELERMEEAVFNSKKKFAIKEEKQEEITNR